MKILPAEDQKARVFHGNDVRGAGLLVDHCHFAEKAAFTKHGEDDLSAILCDEHHLDLSSRDEKEGISRVVLEHDDAAFGIAALSSQISERGQVRFTQAGEERDFPENLHRGQRHSRLAVWKCLAVAYLRLGEVSIERGRRSRFSSSLATNTGSRLN